MTQAQLKTRPSKISVTTFLSEIENEERRRDCKTVARLMREVSHKRATIWGTAIVGFGKYHYKYDSGLEGDFFRIGFSPRRQDLTIYIMPGYTNYEHLLSHLGKHKKGKSCLYIKSLSDINLVALKRLLAAGWRDMEKLYPE